MKKSSDFYDVIINVALTLLFSLTFLINKNEYIATLMIILLTAIVFLIRYNRKEWILYVVGVLTGIILELGGDAIYKLQSWDNASFFGIPIWLPLFWGYAFILISRIGKIIVKE
jgi:hypothetical protein